MVEKLFLLGNFIMNIIRLVSFFTLLVSICLAQNKNFLLDEIAVNKNFCVKNYTEDKVYLVENLVFMTPTGAHLCLNNQGDHIPLPFLCSDSHGCFVPILSESVVDSIKILNDCPWCGQPYIVRCKNPSCPGKPKE